MKTDGGAITVFQLMLSFLLVAITACGVVAGQTEAVLDISGNPVMANAQYFIHARGTRMGITDRIFSEPSTCPQRVVMSGSSSLTLTIQPVIFQLSSDVVRVSTELNIIFASPSVCSPGSRYWRFEDSSKSVVLNGSKSSNDSTFTIKKSEGAYYTIAFGNADLGLEWIGFLDYRLRLPKNFDFAVSFSTSRFL